MKRSLSAFVACLFFALDTAQAHAHLKASMPADRSVLTAAPKQIMLHFSEPSRLMALSIQKEGDKKETAVSSLPKQVSADLSVPVEISGPGQYQLKWRAIGADNHVMSGTLQFTVSAK